MQKKGKGPKGLTNPTQRGHYGAERRSEEVEASGRRFQKGDILANTGSTFKKIRKEKKTSTSSSLKPSLVCFSPVFSVEADEEEGVSVDMIM